MNSIVEHNGKIEKKFAQLSLYQKALFLCLCCERQFTVYENYSKDESWANPKGFRALLDACWDWSISSGAIKIFQVPKTVDFLKIIQGQDASGHASYPYYALDYLFEFTKDKSLNYKNGSRDKPFSAECATNIIDAYLYDGTFAKVTAENDQKIFQHPLMQQEINRQISDLKRLSQENWTKLNWAEIKLETVGQNVLTL